MNQGQRIQKVKYQKIIYYDLDIMIYDLSLHSNQNNRESAWMTSDSENITEKHDKNEDSKFLNGTKYCSSLLQMILTGTCKWINWSTSKIRKTILFDSLI